MVRLFQHKDESIHGDLVIEEHVSGSGVEVHYIPPPSRLAECGINSDEAEKHKTKLVEFDTESGRFTIFPTNTLSSGEDFLKPKYRKVRGIISDSAHSTRHRLRGGRGVRTIATGAVSIRARSSTVFPSRWLTSISSFISALDGW